jgi:glutathione S-transferase
MITVYHLSTSRSERVVWLLEELGLDYQLECFRREENGAAPEAMKAIHPLGRAPVIRDGDVVLAESGAIIEYLLHRHGNGRLAVGPDADAFPRYLYWLHFAEGSLMTLLLIALTLSRLPDGNASVPGTRVQARMKLLLGFVDAELAKVPYFAGADFTAADVMMAFPLTTMRRFLDYDIAPYANIAAYVKRIEARPAYRKAMALAGPDAL